MISFNKGALFNGNGNTRTYDPKGAMQRLDDKLNNLRGGRAWGDWAHMNGVPSAQRKDLYRDIQDLGWQAARFVGGGRSFKIADSYGACGFSLRQSLVYALGDIQIHFHFSITRSLCGFFNTL